MRDSDFHVVFGKKGTESTLVDAQLLCLHDHLFGLRNSLSLIDSFNFISLGARYQSTPDMLRLQTCLLVSALCNTVVLSDIQLVSSSQCTWWVPRVQLL